MTQAISNSPMAFNVVVATKAIKVRIAISLRATMLFTAGIKLVILLLHFVH